MNEIYYIYTLSDPETNIIKYVGKTKNPKNRLYRHMSKYNLKESWTSKNKWLLNLKNNNLMPVMDIIDTGTIDNIDELEINWISKLKSEGIKLKNETIGGDGFDWTGKKHKYESIEKMKMNHPFRKEVIQFDLTTGEILNRFDSIHEASEKTGLFRGHISKCCHGKYCSVGGFYFRFSDNIFPIRENRFKPKKIYKISINGDLDRIYKSVREIDMIKDIFTSSGVRNHIDKETLYKGFYWRTNL